MRIIDLVKLTNTYLAGEQLVYQKLLPYFDAVIDDINSNLNATFPYFSTLLYNGETASTLTYNCFPDNYIKSVVAVGAAYKFYLVDEEGVDSAQDLGYRYDRNLFYMIRDYLAEVPEEYQSDSTGGVILDETRPVYNGFPFGCDCVWR